MQAASDVVDRLLSAKTPSQAETLLISGQGLEGLGRSYFQAVVSCLGQDPSQAVHLVSFWKQVKQVADDPGWVYRAKGAVENYQGQWKKSAESFALAGRFAKDPVNKLVFQIGRIDALARNGKVDQAIAAGKPLAKKLEEIGETFQSARAYLSMANALLWQERYQESLRYLALAEPAFAAMPDSVEFAMHTLSSSSAHLYAGSLTESRTYAERSEEAFQNLGFERYADLASVNLAHVALFEGRPDQALDRLLKLEARHEDDETVDAARLREYLGDAYLRLNLWAEARDRYQGALDLQSLLPALNVADCIYGIGLSHASEGDRAGARVQLKAARARFERIGNQAWTSLCISAIARTYLEDGRTGDAMDQAQIAHQIARQHKSPFALLHAILVLAEGLVLDGAMPSALLREAKNLVKRHGYVNESWRVEYLSAKVKSGQARIAAFRRMFTQILEGRMLTTSVAARSSFLRDKQVAVREYLEELASQPTSARIQEARSVVSRSRAAALLDEIASASHSVSQESLDLMEKLRAELNSVESADTSAGSAKRLKASQSQLSALQRRWTEATRKVISQLEPSTQARNGGSSAILVETDQHVLALHGKRAVKMEISREELQARMRWLEFELMSPITTPDIGEFSAISELKDLGNLVLVPWITDKPSNINVSPDGHLWRIPWQAVSMAVGHEGEVALAMHPDCRVPNDLHLPKHPRVLVWASGDENLPYIEREVAILMKAFPGANLCRTAAEVRQSMRTGEWDVVHVAAHASHRNSNPMFSFFEIGGERIYATEVAQSGFTAKVAVLSACETGSLSFERKDEPDGLARAFLARKAGSVLGSAWRLDDEAASVMMTSFYAALSNGEDLVKSIQSARKEARTRWEHPYYWAPLVLFGGYA